MLDEHEMMGGSQELRLELSERGATLGFPRYGFLVFCLRTSLPLYIVGT